VWAGLVLSLGGAAAWLFTSPPEPESASELGQPGDAVPGATLRAVLVFADAEGRTFVNEEREFPVPVDRGGRIAATIRALVDGPEEGATRTLPEEAKLRRVFLDEETATVYLDFDPGLVVRHPGGTTAEALTLGSIARTLGANFPDVARMQLLVDGEPVETLAGHYDTSQPLEIAAWR
jgi:hypothetical protein